MLMNSVISLFYYFAVPRQMIFKPASDEVPLGASWLVTGVVGLAAVALLVVFILPEPARPHGGRLHARPLTRPASAAL